MLIQDAIAKAAEHCNLSAQEAETVMDQIMDGAATPAQIGAFLTVLRMKGETVDEIAGCARAMRRKAITVRPKRTDLVDTCGTGGDRAGTFNISTTAAFVAAGAGQPVAKHGNRAVSSQCGSADVLAALGANLDLGPEDVAGCIDDVGIGFLFALKLHPAMKYAAPVRREMGIRTVFNILGPLTNPAGASSQLMGVYDGALTAPLAGVLQALGSRCAYIVHSRDGLDELSTTGPNIVSVFCDGRVHTFELDAQDYGLPRAELADLGGGSAADNARITRGILDRSLNGARRDVVMLNAAAALVAGGTAGNLRQGLKMAADSLDSGAALRTLDRFVEYTRTAIA